MHGVATLLSRRLGYQLGIANETLSRDLLVLGAFSVRNYEPRIATMPPCIRSVGDVMRYLVALLLRQRVVVRCDNCRQARSNVVCRNRKILISLVPPNGVCSPPTSVSSGECSPACVRGTPANGGVHV